MSAFKKNTAVTGFPFTLISATDGSAITTGTPVGYVTLDGGTQTAIGDVTPVHEGNGQWTFDLTAGEMNGDTVGFLVIHTSAVNVHFTIKTDTKIVSELNDIAATAVVSAGAITTSSGAVSTVTDVTNLHASAATSAAQTTAQNDLDIVTGAAGAVLDSTATSAQLIDDIMDEVITAAAHNDPNSLARVLRTIREYQGADAIYINTVGGVAGTTDFENGTSGNPVDTLADAVTLATSQNLKKFVVSPGSSITLVSAFVGYEFIGNSWALALGGQNISFSYVSGASITGIATSPTGGFSFRDCLLGAVTLGSCNLYGCGFSGNITLSAADGYRFDQCYSMVAGLGFVTVDFGAVVGDTSLSMRHHSGGTEFQNMGQVGTDTVSLEGKGQFVLNANCVGGSFAVRGNFDKTDNSSGMTITETARYDTTQINDQVVDVLKTDTVAEMSQGVPPTTPTFEEAVMYLYMALTKLVDVDAGFKEFYNNAGTVIYKKALADDGSNYTESKGESGP